MKIVVKISHAAIAFMLMPASRMIIFFQSFALMKLSLALNVSGFSGSSPLSLTKPHNGMRLSVYFVPDLSFRSVITLGGIPMPNSSTFTPLFLAAIKWPISWMITNSINMMIPNTIAPHIMIDENC